MSDAEIHTVSFDIVAGRERLALVQDILAGIALPHTIQISERADTSHQAEEDLSQYNSRYFTLYPVRGVEGLVPLVTKKDFETFDRYEGEPYRNGRRRAGTTAWGGIENHLLRLAPDHPLRQLAIFEPAQQALGVDRLAGIPVEHFAFFAERINKERFDGYAKKSRELVGKLAEALQVPNQS